MDVGNDVALLKLFEKVMAVKPSAENSKKVIQTNCPDFFPISIKYRLNKGTINLLNSSLFLIMMMILGFFPLFPSLLE